MSTVDPLTHLATAALKLCEHHRLVETYIQLIESLEKGGLEQVIGERRLLSEMAQRLSAAVDVLHKLANGDQSIQLDEFDVLVDDVVWDTAIDLQPDLERKYQQQINLVRKVENELNAWENKVVELAKVVDGARLDGAPFALLENDLRASRSRLASLRSALTERLYGDLSKRRDLAIDTITRFEDRVLNTEEQVKRVKTLVKQADLLIMQSRLENDDFEYRVLLRSADRTQTRGINIIQDVRSLSRADREWLVHELAKLTHGINQRLSNDKTPTDLGLALQTLGQFVLQMIIPRQMHELLLSQDWSFSITTNDLELPWELMFLESPVSADPETGQFLCLSKSISRMPLGEVFPPPPRRRRPDTERRRRMLLIHSDPNDDLPAAAGEVDTIERELGQRLEIVRLNPQDATNARLNKELIEGAFDFIHYAGHAFFDTNNPGHSGLELKDNRLTADKIRLLNRGGSLVFLNACESGKVARDSQAQQVSYLLNKPDPVVNLASAFVYSGALGCVSSLWPIYDQAAAELAVKFYGCVLEGDPTGEALRRARVEIRKTYPDDSTWAGYVLYGDPTFRLTEI